MSSDTDVVLGPSSQLLSLNFAIYQDYHFPTKKAHCVLDNVITTVNLEVNYKPESCMIYWMLMI